MKLRSRGNRATAQQPELWEEGYRWETLLTGSDGHDVDHSSEWRRWGGEACHERGLSERVALRHHQVLLAEEPKAAHAGRQSRGVAAAVLYTDTRSCRFRGQWKGESRGKEDQGGEGMSKFRRPMVSRNRRRCWTTIS